MITEKDELFLHRALRLAMNGRGHVEPNPMVGCVLTRNGQTIGEGWHQKYGEPHAEPNALADCKARGNDAAGATAYVTLEPCCHTNKKTPPCAPRLIEARVKRVVVGCLDPNPEVNGKGVAMLREVGIEVDVLPRARTYSLSPVVGGEGGGEGVDARGHQVPGAPPVTTPSPQPSPPGTGEREVDGSHLQQLIAPFILRQRNARPYVTLKWAQSADGKVAGPAGRRVQISNEQSSHFVHVLRSRSDAIMVGVGTILNDDPRLTVRGVHGDRLDQIYILDSAARTPPHAKLFGENGWVTICFSSTPGADEGAKFERLSALTERFQTTSYPVAGDDEGRLRLEDLFSSDYLSETHILVEPGPTLAASFFATNLWDRLIVIEAPAQIADRTAPSAAAIPAHARATATLNLAGDTLTEYLNTRSPAFFAAVPSADFVLAAEEVGSSVA